MRKTILFVVVCLAIASHSFARLQVSDEQMRVSTVAPDLTTKEWRVVPENEQLVYHDPTLDVKISREAYENTKEGLLAYLFIKVVKGKREDLSMFYGTANVAKGAIKSGGSWHVSKYIYFDGGKVDMRGAVSWEVIPDETGTKPVKVILTLETLDGPKVVAVDLK